MSQKKSRELRQSSTERPERKRRDPSAPQPAPKKLPPTEGAGL